MGSYGSVLGHHFGIDHIYSGYHADFIREGTALSEKRESVCQRKIWRYVSELFSGIIKSQELVFVM